MHFGRYEVVLPLGEGPASRVLLARDPILGRQVALKILRADADLPAETRARLVARIRESARAIAGLAHPGFSALHDAGEDESGAPYLVFEFVKGPTLQGAARRWPASTHRGRAHRAHARGRPDAGTRRGFRARRREARQHHALAPRSEAHGARVHVAGAR